MSQRLGEDEISILTERVIEKYVGSWKQVQ